MYKVTTCHSLSKHNDGCLNCLIQNEKIVLLNTFQVYSPHIVLYNKQVCLKLW